MTSRRPSNREYDRFADTMKDELYEKMDQTKAMIACFTVDEKIEF